jgi:hypothetical protein
VGPNGSAEEVTFLITPKSMVCIVSHDAGGAEILASYVDQHSIACRLVLEGPAVHIFRRRLGSIELFPLAEAISSSDWCLVGTSWQSDLEWQAIAAATRAGKRTVAFLDHWVNYPERFVRNGVQHLPDEIWVGDEDARTIARTHFPQTPITLVPNPYFVHVTREIARHEAQRVKTRSADQSVLFVCENLSGHARLRFGNERHWGYTEFDAIEYFFQRISALGAHVGEVVLRPHPSDPPGKYADAIARHAPLARLSTGKPLLDEIYDSDIVVGCESVSLVVAVFAKKRVLCSVPPGQPVNFIDKKFGVEMLRDLPIEYAVDGRDAER